MQSLCAPLMKFAPGRYHIVRFTAWTLLAAMVVVMLAACISENDLTPEQRAYKLDSELMCPVCDGQTLDQSHAQLAEDMKVIVREKIAAGESNSEIRDYFVARYGEVVLAAPEASGFNLLVWLMPAVIAGGGALAVIWVLKNMRQNSSASPESAGPVGTGARDTVTQGPTLADRQLEKYLARVDADIGYGRNLKKMPENPGDERENGNS